MDVGGLGSLRLSEAAKKSRCSLEGENTITVEFQFSVTDPPENATAILAEYVAEDVRVILGQEQGGLFEGGREEAA